jgi:HSP20 family protein
MRDLMLWDRSSLARPVFDEMDRAFNELFGKDFFPSALQHKATYPKMNVYDENGNLCIDAYVPEVPKDKLSINIENGILTLVGNSDSDKKVEDSKYYFREVSRRSFKRSIQLPENMFLEKATADHSDGMLKIKIPYDKKEEVKNIKTINIK